MIFVCLSSNAPGQLGWKKHLISTVVVAAYAEDTEMYFFHFAADVLPSVRSSTSIDDIN